MRTLLLLAATALPAAVGAAPAAAAVTPHASAGNASGPAPLVVTLDASGSTSDQPGGITGVTWAFGDGQVATGAVVTHAYGVGDFTATATITDASGAATVSLPVHSTGPGALALSVPSTATTYGRGLAVQGTLAPARPGLRVRLEARVGARWAILGIVRTDASGAWRTRLLARRPLVVRARWTGTSGPYTGAVSAPARLLVRPALRLGRVTAVVYDGVSVSGAVAPARPGHLLLVVARHGRRVDRRTVRLGARGAFTVDLPDRGPGTYVVQVSYAADREYAEAATSRRVRAILPTLSYGSAGAGVAVVRRRLAALGYRQAVGGARFGGDLVDAVIAFQKVQRLPRDGTVGAAVWRALARPRTVRPRFPGHGDHLDVDKARQVLLIVRAGRVRTVLPVSTGGFGRHTPEGTFRIIRKVPGFDPSPLGTLYDPLYFVGGYAVHGNPSVPSFPASHGCVRIPMWAASWVYATNGIGETVDVYS